MAYVLLHDNSLFKTCKDLSGLREKCYHVSSGAMNKTAAAVLMCFLTLGCAIFRSKTEPYPTGVIFPVKAAARLEYEGEIIDRIEKRGDSLFFSTRKGRVFCVNLRTQETVWRSKVSDDLVTPPIIGEENVYVYDSSHTLFCLNNDGKRIWEKNVPAGIGGGILESGGKIYLGTLEGELMALQISDGRELWSFKAEGAVQTNLVTVQELIVFGCEDHHLYFVDAKGRSAGTFKARGAIFASLAVDGSLLYFGTEDHSFNCLDMNRRKMKWRVLTGGKVVVPPVFGHKKLYFSSWNNVVFCMDKKRGNILWWSMIPARSRYRLELIENRLIATSQSETAVCFDAESGKRRGSYNAEAQIMSNASWIDPFLLVSTYDEDQNMTYLDQLVKEVAVTLKAPGQGPAFTNEEVMVKASPVGFHEPEITFFRRPLTIVPVEDYFYAFAESGDREPVRESSDESQWEWYPEAPGVYGISVEVKDEKEKAETEIIIVVMDKIVEAETSEEEADVDEKSGEEKSEDVERTGKRKKIEKSRQNL